LARVLWLSHLVPHPPKGGVLQRSYHLLRAAASAHDVDLLAFRQRAFHPSAGELDASVAALSEFTRVRGVLDLPSDRSRLARHQLLVTSAFTPAPYSVRWNHSAEMRGALRELIAREPYELVHFDAIGLYAYRDLVPSAARVFNHHNVESQMMLRRAQHARIPLRAYLAWEALRLRRFERVSGRDADLHVSVSALDRERLLEVLPGADVAVVENPVDCDYFQPLSREKRSGHVVFVGRIDAYPNLCAARWLRDEIWPLLRRGGVARSLGIVGRNPPPEIRAWAERDPSVEVTGFVEDVRQAFDEAQVFVCPIVQGGGTRLKLLDAMAMGLPIVCHPMALEGLDVTPGTHLLVAESAANFAAAIEGLLKDDDLRERLGRNARERALACYSLPTVASQLASAYARALDSAAWRRARAER
jgi:glycosyltransferase involved in cell wall biosynthesis